MNRRSFLTTTGALAASAPLASRLLAADTKKSPAPAAPATAPAAANQPPPLSPRFGDGRDWWFEKRFGMFVHWGLSSIEGWHEQDQWRRRLPRACTHHRRVLRRATCTAALMRAGASESRGQSSSGVY
jgi:hypothetical protein